MPTPDEIRRRAKRLDAAITDLVESFAQDLADTLASVRTRVVVLTDRLETEGGRVKSTEVNLRVARTVARELTGVLTAEGYDALVEQAIADTSQLLPLLDLPGDALWNARPLVAWRQLQLDTLIDAPADAIRRIERAMLRGIVGATPRAQLLEEILNQLDLTLPQVRTIYDTAVSEFVRLAVELSSDGTPGEAFLFSGPIDALLRPFCEDRVGKVYTRQTIEAMDNGQLGNVLVTGGGYNCRHTWVPIPAGDPLAGLADTGRYADDAYADDVRDARAARARLKDQPRRKRGV